MKHHIHIRRRWTSALAMSVVGVLALSACANTGGGESTENPEVNLLLIETDASKELRDDFIPAFEKESGIKVNVDLVPEAGMDAKLSLSLGSGSNQYDVVQVGAKNLSTLVASGWIQPLDDFVADGEATPTSYTDGFPEELQNSLRLNDGTYTMPYQVGADLLFYNKDMFEAAGLDPAAPPRTMDEIVAAAETLTDPDADQAGFVARGSREGNANSFSWIMMWFLNGGRWLGADGEPRYDVMLEPEAIRTAEQYDTLMSDYAPAGASNYTHLEAQAAMQQGKAAMWLDAAQLGPTLEDESQSKIAGKVGYAAPVGEGDDYIVGAVWGFSMATGTAQEDAAWQLIQYLTSRDVAVGQALSGTNGSPARVDALSDPEVKAAYNADYLDAMAEAIAHANPNYSPIIPEGTEIRGAVSLALSKILGDQADVQTAMTEANESIEKLVK